jgi:hypothetical protein
LHTYVGENRRWKTGNNGAVRMALGGGEWLLRWSSSEKNRMNRLLTFPPLLLRASISPGGDELNLHEKKSLAARVWCLRGKIRRVWAAIYRASWSYL